MACMTSGASSVTLQSLYWRSSDNFSVPAESSRVNWCSPARRIEDEILESRSLFKGRYGARGMALHLIRPDARLHPEFSIQAFGRKALCGQQSTNEREHYEETSP